MNTFVKSFTKNSLAISFFLFGALQADEPTRLSIGGTLPVVPMVDQWDKEIVIPTDTEKLMFIADMEGSKLVVPALESKGDAYLAQKKAVLVSDIHRMPSIITRFVALPKMRSYPFTIRLIREEKLSDPYPRNKGQVTLLLIKQNVVTDIQFATSEEEVVKFLEFIPKEEKKKGQK